MRLKEILVEYGSSHGFPGTGQGVFRQAYYVYIASELHDIQDEHAKEFLTDWFVDIFNKDNFKFKEDIFRKAVLNGIRSGKPPVFQQRHFYYLAHFICNNPDENIRDFLYEWLGKIAGSTNPQFRRYRWKEFCGLELTPDEKKLVNGPRRRTSEYDPALGRRKDTTVDLGKGYKEED